MAKLKCPLCGAQPKDITSNGNSAYLCKLCFHEFQWPANAESKDSDAPVVNPMEGLDNLLAMYGSGKKKEEKPGAVERMDIETLRKIAYEYEYGEKGREKNLAKACEYFKVAAEKGDGEAMYKVAYAYEHGQGVELNMNKAYFWYKEGLRVGNGRCGRVIRERFAKFVVNEKAKKEQNSPLSVNPSSQGGVNVYEQTVAGVLEVTCTFNDCRSSGSGLLIDNGRYAITNAHVVTHNAKPCPNVFVKVAGETISAQVVMLGDNNGGHGRGVDLALLKLSRVPARGKTLVFENFDNVRIGEQVYVIGNSLGDGTCITSGIVSDKCRVLSGRKLLMTDCPINGGNSGGPIFNAKGRVIGVIVSSRINADGSATEGMNYAIPSYIVEEFIAGKHTAVRLTSGGFSLPSKPAPPITKAKAPCPRCNSWNTNIQNGIFYCMDCDYEG